MGKLRVLNSMGDSQVAWDAAAVAAGDPESQAAVAEAERIFNEARARGSTAFSVSQGKAPTRLDHFDATEEQILLVPRVVGG
jgi:hypothetical protein